MSSERVMFWEDLARDLEDPEFLREFIAESVRVATVDRIVNSLDEARQDAGLTKADLARAVGAEPASVRRFFTGAHGNPNLGTVSELAAALGLRITLEPLPAAEKKVVTKPLREGGTGDSRLVAERVGAMRSGKKPRSIPA